METQGIIFGALDVTEAVWYLFLIFFAGLILYLRREDRREGYPLEEDTTGKLEADFGLLFFAPPKTFELPHGGERKLVPTNTRDRPVTAARRTAVWPGAPIEPTGDPLVDGIGPAAWADRANVPDTLHDGAPKIVPLRAAPAYQVAKGDPDPRGYQVIGCDKRVAGVVEELWVDQMEHLVRYLELELVGPDGQRTGRRKLLPMGMAILDAGRKSVKVRSIRSDQFANVPETVRPNQITLYEEERVVAYYGGGYLYATPDRAESLL